ncbi:MAG: ABC transporter permease [Actinomycetia bacterium]|nr:ABC transporter permease [Actinomycetes bacterium]
MLRRLIVKRSLFAIVQLLGASIIIFVIVRLLPSDPATAILGTSVQEEQVEALRERLGLNKSIPEQYWIWLQDVFHGDLGRSWFTSNNVVDDLGQRLPATFELILLALFVSIVILIPLGVITARRSRSIYSKVADKGVFSYGMLAGATPDFWLGLVLLFLFWVQLDWVPAPLGRISISITPPDTITGFLIIDSTIQGNWAALKSALGHLVLPVFVLAFVYGAPLLKMTRNTVSRMLDAEFIDQGRAAGLSDRMLTRMALKNSLPPVITLAGVVFGFVVGGAVLVETVFSWGGVGQYAVQSIANADFNAIQGFVLVATGISIFIYLAVDILHYLIDPRVEAG